VRPPERVPALVDAKGFFRADMARLGLDIALRREVRRQLRAGSRRSSTHFGRPASRSITFNAHKHFHLHPVIAAEIIAVGARHGIRGLRVPREPGSVPLSHRAASGARSRLGHGTWAALLARRATTGRPQDARRGVRPRLVRRDDDSRLLGFCSTSGGAQRDLSCIRRPLMVSPDTRAAIAMPRSLRRSLP